MDEEALLYEDDYEQYDDADATPLDATPVTEAPEGGAGTPNGQAADATDEAEALPARGAEEAGPSGRSAGEGGAAAGSSRQHKRDRGSSQGIRYFIIRSNSLQNIHISVRVGAWATTRGNDVKLDDAFRHSKEVRLLYSVNGSSAFQGYAVMRSPIGKFGRPVTWENGKQFGNPFTVEWRILFDLPHSECEHIRNPYNENRQVYKARDGTELPQEQGDKVVRLMQERATAAGARPPRQQLAMLESGGLGPGVPGPRPPMPMGPAGRMALGPHGPPMGAGIRPMPGRGMLGMGPQGVMGHMGSGMGPALPGGIVPSALLEQISAAMAMNTFNPAALGAMLQQANVGLQPGVGGPMQQPGAMQALATAMVAQMAALPPEQQAMAMTAISASNPMLAEAVASVIAASGPGILGPGAAVQQPSATGMAQGMLGAGLGGVPGGMGGAGVGGMGGGMGVGNQMQANQQELLQQQEQQQHAQQQLMSFNRDDYVIEGSDGRLRSGRSRSRSRSPVPGQRGGGGGAGGGSLDFSSMTYEQYLQQYSCVQQEVQRRVGGSNGQHRGRSPERLPRRGREPTPASQGFIGQGTAARGGGDGAMAGAGGGSAVVGMAAKGGQPYSEEEYIRVTQVWYASRGQQPPSESYIRQHYRQMLSQLQTQR